MNTQKNNQNRKRSSQRIRETVIFAMLGSLMFCSKVLMEVLPNIHLIGMLTMVYTLVFRKKALIPIYIFVLITGVSGGFATWWLPYLYIWTVLWGVTMLLPQKLNKKLLCVIYPVVCALHGLAYGTLYAPVQALVFGMDFEQMLAWIAAGIPWDVLHCVGNLIAGMLILPLSEVLCRFTRKPQRS